MDLQEWRLLCVAKKPGFHGDRMHFPPGDQENPKRAGNQFALRADGLRFDEEGKLMVDKDLKPLLPSWVEPREEVKPIDKSIPHVVVTPKKAKHGKRILPIAVKKAAPVAWPQNVQKKDASEPDRVVKIRRPGGAEESED